MNALHFQSIVNNWRTRLSPSTVWTYTCYLRMLARTLGELAGQQGLHREVPRAKVPRPRTQIVSSEQIASLLANAEPWLRVFITLCCALGLRHSEALDVKPEGFSPNRHTIRFKAKGGEMQTMPTTEEVEALFANAPPGDTLTPLVQLYRGRPLTRNTCWWFWRKAKRKAGITAQITPHDLRRTAAVAGYDLTHDLRFVWQLLRHKNLSTTARYLEHVNPTEMRSLMQQLWTPKTELKQ